MAKRLHPKTTMIVNKETGEVINNDKGVYELEEGDQIKTKQQIEYFMSRIIPGLKRKKKGEHFLKLIFEASKVISTIFDDDDIIKGFIQDLYPLITYPDNVIANETGYLNITDMANLMKKDKSAISRRMKKLIQYGVVAKAVIGNINGNDRDTRMVYIFNPYIARNGEHVSNFVYELFEESGWKNSCT